MRRALAQKGDLGHHARAICRVVAARAEVRDSSARGDLGHHARAICRVVAARSGAGGSPDDRGSAHVELVVLAVVSFLFVAVIVFVGRLNVGSAHAEAAARSAARAISVARDPAAAVSGAESDAAETLRVGSAMCTSMSFSPDITPDEVTVTISCQVDLSEATLIQVPGEMTVSATAREVIDQYRERTP